MRAVLTEELQELDIYITRAWVAAGVLGLVASLAFALIVSARIGLACAAML